MTKLEKLAASLGFDARTVRYRHGSLTRECVGCQRDHGAAKRPGALVCSMRCLKLANRFRQLA